jgi:hypothetical protein
VGRLRLASGVRALLGDKGLRAMERQFTAIIEREDGGYVALCPELDIASQNDTVSEARANR